MMAYAGPSRCVYGMQAGGWAVTGVFAVGESRHHCHSLPHRLLICWYAWDGGGCMCCVHAACWDAMCADDHPFLDLRQHCLVWRCPEDNTIRLNTF